MFVYDLILGFLSANATAPPMIPRPAIIITAMPVGLFNAVPIAPPVIGAPPVVEVVVSGFV